MIDKRISSKLAWQLSEDSLQIKCAQFAKKCLYQNDEPQVFHHVANGGNRSRREGARFKLMGVLPGVPDIFLPLRSETYSGLYIELKNFKGKLAEAQVDFMMAATREGFLCIVINDLETFCTVFEYYIKQRKTNERTN